MHTQLLPASLLKGFFTLFIFVLFLGQVAFAQQKTVPLPKQYKIQPGSITPWQVKHPGHSNQNHSNLKFLGDTSDVLDYSTYNEIMAGNLQIAYNGSWNATNPTNICGNELTSFLTIAAADNGDYSFAQVVYDSLAFANYANTSVYSLPMAGSTITLDSVGMFIGVYGDTFQADGTMANDSLLISIYSVVGNAVSSTPVQTVVNSGYAGLSPFFVGSSQLKYVSLPVSQQFNPGETFAVKVTYLNKDTSSHCILSYSYPDSCQQIVIQGTTYASPAYPSPFAHSTSYGEIDSTSVNGVTVTAIDNQKFYNLATYNIPLNCSYVYVQNWEILSYVTVNIPYSTQIQASQATACEGETINLNAEVYGTDSPNITYTWAASTGGVLLGGNTAAASLTVPSNVISNITVTLTVNDGSGNVSDSMVIINCHLNVAPGGSQTVCTNSYVALQAAVTGGTIPYTYQWQASGGALSCTGCANPVATVSQNTVYTVTVTDAAQTTATASYSYTVNGITNDVGMTVVNTGILCNSQNDATTVYAYGGIAPYTINWGNGSITTGDSTQTNSYGLPGGLEVISVTDSNGCVDAYFDTVVNNGPVVTLVQAIEPGCPGSTNGEIITSVTGGTAPYSYNWENYSNSDTLTGAQQGYYQLIVTDANGCTASFGYTLNAAQDYNYYVYLNTTTANCGATGGITTSVSGGVLPYSYLWSNSATTANIQTSVTAVYEVTVTDSLGCQAQGYAYAYTTCQSFINGTAFYDSLGTCSPTGNTGMPDLIVEATSAAGDQFFGYTDNNGNFSLNITDTGTFELSALNYWTGICGNLTFCSNSPQTVYLPVLGDSSVNNNIGLENSTGSFNLGIHPGWTSADPGFVKQYWVFYYNSSPAGYNGPATVTLNYDPNLVYLYTDESPAPVVDNLNHTLTWQVSSVPDIYNNNWAQLDGYFQVPSTLSLNYQLQSTFTITPKIGDCDTTDNQYSYSEIVTGSHDPNEKTVSPSGPVTADDSVLTYTIHFQNTGTDSTHFIVIRDTLSPNLDPATVRNIASSDAYSKFGISGSGILTWTFNPLRVVDSATNPGGSKRFIMFTVHKKPNLPIGTPINNTASVYFDYNTAVVTNTVSDTEALPTYIFEVSNNSNVSVKAFPNPFNDVTHIVVTGINEKFGFELYDVTGRLQQTIPSIDNNQFDVHKGQLANGVYLYRILVTGKPAAYGKLVVE
jgi:uncharacterized repeat protein (TIGR01451 family)